MVEKIHTAQVRRATQLVQDIAAALEGPSSIRHDAKTAVVLAQALVDALEDLRQDALDIELDRLVAIRNLTRSLDERAHRLRVELAALIVEIMDTRPELMEPGASSRDPADTQSGLVALDLVRDLAGDFEARTNPEDTRPVAVVAHRRRRTYFLPEDPGYATIPEKYRLVFPESESAEIAGFRRGKS